MLLRSGGIEFCRHDWYKICVYWHGNDIEYSALIQFPLALIRCLVDKVTTLILDFDVGHSESYVATNASFDVKPVSITRELERVRYAMYAAFLICVSAVRAQQTFPVDGDPIGADTSTTDHAGGFTAVEYIGVNLGQPAVQVTLNGEELLTDLRVIVFGLPSRLRISFFNQFDYHLDVWRSSDYFAGATPQFRVELGQPSNIGLIPAGADQVVPSSQFGTSGISGGNRLRTIFTSI